MPYRFEVRAVGPGGDSAWSTPSGAAVPHEVLEGPPRVAVILMEGVDSSSVQPVWSQLLLCV